MSRHEAVGHILWMAFKAIDKKAKEAFLSQLCHDSQTREDLLDMATIESRRHEKSRPLGAYLANRRKDIYR